jgi:hypothetical protein
MCTHLAAAFALLLETEMMSTKFEVIDHLQSRLRHTVGGAGHDMIETLPKLPAMGRQAY